MEELHLCLWGEDNFKNFIPSLTSSAPSRLLVLAPLKDHPLILPALTVQNKTPLVFDWSSSLPIADNLKNLEDYLSPIEYNKIVLNVSTGDRHDAFRLFQWAMQRRFECYLIDDEDKLHWLWPANRLPIDIPEIASLKNYFNVHRIDIVKFGLDMPITSGLRSLVQQWGQNPQQYPLFRALNWLASSATQISTEGVTEQFTAHLKQDWQRDRLVYLLEDLAEQALIECHDSAVTFINDTSRFFANGGWLELYVYDQVRALRTSYPQIKDIRLGVEVQYLEGVKNELDVIFLADNQLHLIEVKSSYLSDKTAAANQLIYKLEALSSALGLEVKAMVISLFDLPSSSEKRAGLYNLKVLSGSQFTRLSHHIAKWITE